jgi:hypothetical protein
MGDYPENSHAFSCAVGMTDDGYNGTLSNDARIFYSHSAKEDMNSYLLDTSALRGLSNSDLQLLVDRGVNLYVSPYSVCELSSHLEDSEKFDRLKGQVMKCRYTKVLDDPQATFWNVFSYTNRQRLLANDIVKASFAALHAANSLKEFYSSYIRDREGNVYTLSQHALRAKEILSHYEKEYIEFITKIVGALSSYEKDLHDPQNQRSLILGLIEGEIIKLVRRGALWATLREDTINNTFIYYAYIFYRSLEYFQKGKTKIDANDFEDANICRHLRVDTPLHLITGDKGFYKAIRQISFLAQNVEPKIQTSLQVDYPSYLQGVVRKKEAEP